ncbi:MAG: hypothetical protein ACUVQZ_03280 [Candidatus Caldatribacteriaceae bacterium]
MRVAVLGSTGFLGEQILEVLAQEKEYRVVLLSGYQNVDKLVRQAEVFQPRYIFSPYLPKKKEETSESKTKFIQDMKTLREILLGEEVEGIFFANSGISILELFLELLSTPKVLWVASKEMIILAGEVKPRNFFQQRENFIPLDSEHNALWQMFRMVQKKEIYKVYLTASGGPFYDWQGKLSDITPEMALSHPNWKMGTKITVDSANLINKGLEVIEAAIIFDLDFQEVDVLIQRESYIHALLEFKDGFTMALLSPPDMRSVIFNAIHPERNFSNPFSTTHLLHLRSLTFDYPVPDRFSGFYLALKAGKRGAGYPTLFCGADEACVRAFLKRRITFDEIPSIIERVLEQEVPRPQTIAEVRKIYRLGMRIAEDFIAERSISG